MNCCGPGGRPSTDQTLQLTPVASAQSIDLLGNLVHHTRVLREIFWLCNNIYDLPTRVCESQEANSEAGQRESCDLEDPSLQCKRLSMNAVKVTA